MPETVRRWRYRAWPQWTASPRVALAFGAAGASIGLGLAGYGLFTAQGSAIRGVPAEDAAIVNGVPILRSDVVAQIESGLGKRASQASAAEHRQVLDDMIREELMVQRGLELGEPATDPDTRAALVSAVQSQIAVDATSEVPTDVQLRDFYENHRKQYSSIGVMTVRDLVPARAVAASELVAAVAAMRAGLPVADAPARFGLKDSGKVDGEELYFAAKIHLGGLLFAAAAAMDTGAVAGPLGVSDGPHILVMQRNVRPQTRAFEEVRNQVYNDYKADLETRLRDGEYRYLRAKAEIQLAPDLP